MTMEVDPTPALGSWPGRWSDLKKVLERSGPLTPPTFQPNTELLPFLQEHIRVLVIGAGGLGCELLKNLAMMGFRQITVIDMDTIDLSNLNRQFLFRQKDIGRFKAEVAAEVINARVPGVRVTPHSCKIQDFDAEFYQSFHVVVCGLDSIVARRWMNGMLLSLLEWDDDTGELDKTTIIPLIDGGTEGFKGNARVIYPGMNACIDCTLDLFPPQVNFPLCTIAHTPRLPEHCVEYARMLLWPKEKPFGDSGIDGDDPHHISWIFERAKERADEYGIQGVNYRLTQGVVKHIIPAVASTNAVIAAACTTEVFKVVTSCFAPLTNYMVFNDTEGIYTYVYEQERNENCAGCSRTPQKLNYPLDTKLETIVTFLTESPLYQMKAPGLTCSIGGKNKTLYMQSVASIEAATRANLKLSLSELGLGDGSQIVVADSTSPVSIVFVIKST